MRPTCILSAAVLVMSTAAGTALEAQSTSRGHSPGEIARLLRTEGRTGPAILLLTQSRGPLPREVLDAIADSLVIIAIESAGTDTASLKIQDAARTTLMLAGIGRQGRPYTGAAERLFRIAVHTESSGAACALAKLPNKEEALTYLSRLAAMDNWAAHGAVRCMGEIGPAGLAALRTLHGQGVVTQKYAKWRLDGIARQFGWQ